MKAIVLYESMFGNTRLIAEAVKWAADPEKAVTLEPEAPGRGVRHWLNTTSVAPLFAAFATRADIPILLSGNAAAQIERAMKTKVTRRVVPGENFLVTKGNRLQDDEATRAGEWGRLVAREAFRLIETESHTR